MAKPAHRTIPPLSKPATALALLLALAPLSAQDVVVETAAPTADAAVDPAIQKAITEGKERSQVMVFQDILCHRFGHRLTGSDNFDRAAQWALEQFQGMGLEARIEPWGEWNVRWNRGQWMGRILAPEAMELQVASPAWTGGTMGQVKGPMVAMAEDDEALAQQLQEGPPAWLYGKPPRDGSERHAMLEAAARDGKTLGVVTSARLNGGADNRRYPNQIRVFGDRRSAPYKPYENRQRLVHVVVRNDQAERIEEMLQEEGAAIEAQFEMRNRFTPGPVTLNNVIAELKGTEKPDEIVIICAHLDSWHQGTGATDNGTGVCSTLEAARILTTIGAKPKRTIRFCLWAGEEQGLLGSREYVKRHRQELDKLAAVFNHDSGTNWANGITVSQPMEAQLAAVFAPIMGMTAPDPDHDGPTFNLNVQETIRAAGGGSDHASFNAIGIPGWSWSLRGELPYGYGWHSQWDTYDLVVPEFQAHTATVAAVAALGVANLDELLSREGITIGRGGNQAQPLVEGRLGVTLDDLKFKTVVADGWAAKAGAKPGDVLIAVGKRKVTRLVDAVRGLRDADDPLTIKVIRGDEELTLPANK